MYIAIGLKIETLSPPSVHSPVSCINQDPSSGNQSLTTSLTGLHRLIAILFTFTRTSIASTSPLDTSSLQRYHQLHRLFHHQNLITSSPSTASPHLHVTWVTLRPWRRRRWSIDLRVKGCVSPLWPQRRREWQTLWSVGGRI